MKKRFIFSLLTFIAVLSFSGCSLAMNMFGSRTEKFLYHNRTVIKEHHDKWIGDDMSRSVLGDMVVDTEEQLSDNLDYLAQNDWITAIEYYPGEIPEDIRAQYEGALPDYIRDHIIIFSTNNGIRYFVTNLNNLQYIPFNTDTVAPYIVNIDLHSVPDCGGGYPGEIRTKDDSFYMELEWIFCDKFPYPMHYHFDSTKTTMHTDPERPGYLYWGVDLTGIESEIYRSYELVTIQEYMEFIESRVYDMLEADRRVQKLMQDGEYWPF